MPPGNSRIPRDQYGRPKIIPVGGGKSRSYARMSTVSKALKDSSNLVDWKARMAAVGLVLHPALLTKLMGEVAMGDLTDYRTKRAIDAIVEDACQAAGASDRADIGTGLHNLTEALDMGRPLPPVPAEIQVRLDEYREKTTGAGYTPLSAEEFVVVDELQLAGSFDRLWLCPDGKVRVGDLKTGAWDAKEPMGVAAQLAGYAHGKRYDPTTGEREDLHPDLDLHTGLLISMPPDGGCEVIGIDLDLGWAVLMLASKVYAVKKIRAKEFRAV